MNDEPVHLAFGAVPADVSLPVSRAPASDSGKWQALRTVRFDGAATMVLLALATIFFFLHFLHLNADFPNHSPWVDWAKYTDEGWYGDAAIRHYLTGHWYWKGDFNPAVALPVWPALEWLAFRFTGVSPAAARVLTLCVFGLTLLSLYRLVALHTRSGRGTAQRSLAAPLTVFLLCTSPFVYVFERMAVLEPLLIALGVLSLLAASHLDPPSVRAGSRGSRRHWRVWLPGAALTLLLPAMVLTKTTAVCLLPAIAYMVWARAGYRVGLAARLAAAPAMLGTALWCLYFFLFVRPHYMEDYRYLFFANAHTGVDQSLAGLVLDTLGDGAWMGLGLYIAFFAVLGLAVFWRPRLFANPLAPALLLWIGGYAAFLIYHNSLQPRYYLVLAVPVTAFVSLGLDSFSRPGAFLVGPGQTLEQAPMLGSPTDFHSRPAAGRSAAAKGAAWEEAPRGTEPQRRGEGRMAGAGSLLATAAVLLTVLAIAIPDVLLEWSFIGHPTYDFQAAAQGIKRIVLADRGHSNLILGISGSDLTLMTGLPSIDDDYGTLDLDTRVARYRPGWFVAWNEVDDDKADALSPLFRLTRVAAFPAMDDPDRNLLILYRLDPVAGSEAPARPHRKRFRAKTLVTRTPQQPGAKRPEHKRQPATPGAPQRYFHFPGRDGAARSRRHTLSPFVC